MRLLTILLLLFVVSCSESKSESKDFAKFFYPEMKEDKYYVFRNMANGLEEQFHRVYQVEDSKGKHLVVEKYSGDGRITEAYNFNLETLKLDDHMIVDKQAKKRQAELLQNHVFPLNKEDKTNFASRFPGIADSTFFLLERKNIPNETVITKREVLGKNVETLDLVDDMNFSVFNPYRKTEKARETKMHWYYAKGYGLVEWHDEKKNVHFVLEDIVDAQEGMKLIGRNN